MSSASSLPAASPRHAALQRTPWTLQAASSHAGSSSDSDQEAEALSDGGNDAVEQGESAPSDSEAEDPTHSRKRRQRIHFDVQQLQTVYHLPLKTAAERLGICEAALKRICRRNRIHKWPYRQLSSVRRRIAELKDRRAVMLADVLPVDRLESPERRGVQETPVSVTPAQFDDRLRRLEVEQDQIVRSAHQPRRSRKTVRPSAAPCQHQPQQLQLQQRRPVLDDMLTGHLDGFQSNIADLPPLDLARFDRDFPLLFLANVCESVRAYN
ncbi:hypothetical protein PHYPSEUDO_012842 [Phytophthora pseudosyringae]|uniref:RWP-RK domain-containing protein n=1 Tax=Phytophthora pseudosyringae TaxID=221518 RepID=A0A8T1V6Y5_9STRA|nr:hypothetical protein PHYPSEUDO_012842 [Phytophthora pseudosyringae]